MTVRPFHPCLTNEFGLRLLYPSSWWESRVEEALVAPTQNYLHPLFSPAIFVQIEPGDQYWKMMGWTDCRSSLSEWTNKLHIGLLLNLTYPSPSLFGYDEALRKYFAHIASALFTSSRRQSSERPKEHNSVLLFLATLPLVRRASSALFQLWKWMDGGGGPI